MPFPSILKRKKSSKTYLKRKDSFRKLMSKKAKNLIKGDLDGDPRSIETDKHKSTIWKDDEGTKVILNFKNVDKWKSSPNSWAKGMASDLKKQNINKDNFVQTLIIEGDNNEAFRKLAMAQIKNLNEIVSDKAKKVKLAFKEETQSGNKILLTFNLEKPVAQQAMVLPKIKKNDGEIDAQARIRNLKEKWDSGTIDKRNISDDDKDNIELFLNMVGEASRQWADANNSPSAKDLLELNKFYNLIESGDGENFSKLLDGDEVVPKAEDFLKAHQEKLKSVEQLMQDQSAIFGASDYAKKLGKEVSVNQIKTKARVGAETVGVGALGQLVPGAGQVVGFAKLLNRIRSNNKHIKQLKYIKGEAEAEGASPEIIKILDNVISRKEKRNIQAGVAVVPALGLLNTGRSVLKGAYNKATGKISERVDHATLLINNAMQNPSVINTKISKQIILELVGKDVYPQIIMTIKGNELLSDKMRTTV